MAEEAEGELLRRVCALLAPYGAAATGGAPLESAAYQWLAAGFADADEIEDWLRARCFRARDAQTLERAGLTPEQAALRTTAGRGTYEDTVAYKFARGDLTIEEARRVATSEFWQ
ncbi:MAG TPA: hypothetical protein VF546_11465 [Pyrinomonadaceae bacterium]|jgi:hypothetical protein